MSDYDPAQDTHDSYFAAIEAKRLRGDTTGWRPMERKVRVSDQAHGFGLFEGRLIELEPK